MKYSINNVQISLTLAFAEFLRERGYDVYWHAAGVKDTQTAGLATPKATVTLVPEFPAIPQFIVRLKGESTDASQEIVVPALTLQMAGSPKKRGGVGLGHTEREWEREVIIDGLALDDFQQKEFAELLHDFWAGEEWKRFAIYNYDADRSNPPELAPVTVEWSEVSWVELVHEVEAVRYYFRARAAVSYTE